MAAYKVLDELVYTCTRCKLDLNHRITVMKGSVPAKVLCLTCRSERAYRAVNPATATPKAKRTRSAAARPKAQIQTDKWRLQLEGSEKTPKPYRMTDGYTMGDIIAHTKFGRGIVTDFPGSGKIAVFFDEGGKVLIGEKAA